MSVCKGGEEMACWRGGKEREWGVCVVGWRERGREGRGGDLGGREGELNGMRDGERFGGVRVEEEKKMQKWTTGGRERAIAMLMETASEAVHVLL